MTLNTDAPNAGAHDSDDNAAAYPKFIIFPCTITTDITKLPPTPQNQ